MYVLKHSQKLPISIEESWEFFSNPLNLTILIPESLSFEVICHDETCRMYAGQIITHKLRPLWKFPVEWITEITHVDEPNYFIDEQRFGPYKFWHHEHHFKSIPNGVEIIDLIYYAMPYGLIGNILHALKVKKDLDHIFSYRHIKLEKLFGRYL